MSTHITTIENVTEFRSDATEILTSNSLMDQKRQILESIQNRKKIKSEVNILKADFMDLNKKLRRRMLFPFGEILFKSKIKFLTTQINKCQNLLEEKNAELNKHRIELKKISNELQIEFETLKKSFLEICKSEYIWDVTLSQLNDRVKTRSAGSRSINRERVKIYFSTIDLIISKYDALQFQNANGGTIYIYPTLLIVVDQKRDIALLDYTDISLEFRESRFIEEDSFPTDAKQIGTTWSKVNKDGSRDKRFSDNYQIPIALYGELHWKSNTGLNEVYQLSNFEAARNFQDSFMRYKELYCMKKLG